MWEGCKMPPKLPVVGDSPSKEKSGATQVLSHTPVTARSSLTLPPASPFAPSSPSASLVKNLTTSDPRTVSPKRFGPFFTQQNLQQLNLQQQSPSLVNERRPMSASGRSAVLKPLDRYPTSHEAEYPYEETPHTSSSKPTTTSFGKPGSSYNLTEKSSVQRALFATSTAKLSPRSLSPRSQVVVSPESTEYDPRVYSAYLKMAELATTKESRNQYSRTAREYRKEYELKKIPVTKISADEYRQSFEGFLDAATGQYIENLDFISKCLADPSYNFAEFNLSGIVTAETLIEKLTPSEADWPSKIESLREELELIHKGIASFEESQEGLESLKEIQEIAESSGLNEYLFLFHQKNLGYENKAFPFYKHAVLQEFLLIEAQTRVLLEVAEKTKFRPDVYDWEDWTGVNQEISGILLGLSEDMRIRSKYPQQVYRKQVSTLSKGGSLSIALTEPAVTEFHSEFKEIILSKSEETINLSRSQHDALKEFERAIIRGTSAKGGKAEILMGTGEGKVSLPIFCRNSIKEKYLLNGMALK